MTPVAINRFPRPSRRPKGAPGGEKSPRHKLGEPLEGEVGKEGHVGQVVFVPWASQLTERDMLTVSTVST